MIQELPIVLQSSLTGFHQVFLAGLFVGVILYFFVGTGRTRKNIFLIALVVYLVSEVIATVIWRDAFAILAVLPGIPALGIILGLLLCQIGYAGYKRLAQHKPVP